MWPPKLCEARLETQVGGLIHHNKLCQRLKKHRGRHYDEIEGWWSEKNPWPSFSGEPGSYPYNRQARRNPPKDLMRRRRIREIQERMCLDGSKPV